MIIRTREDVLTDGMLAGVGQEDLLKVRTADGQHYFVGMQESAVARQGHVD